MEIDEVQRHAREESGDLADFAAGLSAQDWDTPSTCAGWQVKHIVSHMATGATYPLPRMLAALVRARGDKERAAHRMALEHGDTHPQADVVATFRRGHEGEPLTFFARSLDPREVLVDHLVHHQDIRRTLDRPREIPRARLIAAFDVLPEVGGTTNTGAVVRGLRLHASDLDRSVGDGPVVTGPAEALIMAAAGRREVLAELSGEGKDTLAARLG